MNNVNKAGLTKSEIYARAEQRMRSGKHLVISGFIVAVVGIIAYCVVCLSAGVNQELGSTLLKNMGWLVFPTLGVIGLGTLLWLMGSYRYLIGAMDSDPAGPDLNF
jgi:cbb3-type cytochrome oxidase subunit 1